MTRCTRAVTRETNERDPRTGRPIVLTIEQGGRVVHLRAKGTRRRYTVGVKDVWLLGAKIAAQEIRQAKRAARLAKKREGIQ